jgi:hypothetical protein
MQNNLKLENQSIFPLVSREYCGKIRKEKNKERKNAPIPWKQYLILKDFILP